MRLLAIAFLLALAAPARAADTGQFLFINATPQPVQAGGTVRLQLVAVNQGSETWDVAKTYLIAEIYDSANGYLARTERAPLTAPVAPGQPLSATLTYEVPADWKGAHSARVFLVRNDVRVIESNPVAFGVEGLAAAPPKPLPVTFGGNILGSFRTDSGPGHDRGEIALSLAGKMFERPYDFRMNTFHERNDKIDVRTVLFNYYGPTVNVGAGDVSPNYSPLAVSGQGIRGVLLSTRKFRTGTTDLEMSAVAGRIAEGSEGTATADGTFARSLYGTEVGATLPLGFVAKANYVQVSDDRGSLNTPGPTLTAVDNRSGGMTLSWVGAQGIKADAAYQVSSFEANRTSTASAVSDNAWKLGLALDRGKWNATTGVSRTGADFTALGAPGVAKDRLSYDLAAGVRPKEWLSLNAALNQFRDDLEDDPAKVATHQRSINTGATVALPKEASLSANYSLTRVAGSPRTTLNNKTVASGLSLSKNWTGKALSLSYNRSEFTDLTSLSHNLLTDSYSGSWTWNPDKAFSTTLSYSGTNTKDQLDGSVQKTRTYSGNMTAEFVPDTVFLQSSVSLTDSRDNDATAASSSWTDSESLELTWKKTKSLSLTAGGYRTGTDNRFGSTGDSINHGYVFRASYSF